MLPVVKSPIRPRPDMLTPSTLSPAFLLVPSLRPLSSPLRTSTRPRICACAPPPVSIPPPAAPGTAIPSSLDDATRQATIATRAAVADGRVRAFIVIDTKAGDETYTLLKTSVPIVRKLLPILEGRSVEVLLPDAGAAALAKRDWGEDGASVPEGVRLEGIDRWKKSDGVEGVFIVAPRASEVEDLERAVEQAGESPLVVVNPDLIDMGLTGLSLNARMLRERVINTFETAYYLKVTGWGVLLRAYPGDWGVWVDDAAEASGFRRLKTYKEKPTSDEIEEVLDDEANDGSQSGGDWMKKLGRFLKVYMRG